jgi:MFS family permease
VPGDVIHAPARSLVRGVRTRVDQTVGAPARRQVITVFACVLGLESADQAAVGANAMQLQLQSGLHIDKTDIGVLLAVGSVVAALITVPAGMLVDRHTRTRLLSAAIACWGLAMLATGFAGSFAVLLAARLGLSVVTAIAGPALASLLGDYFPEGERAKIYGYVLSGELVGGGFGVIVAGQFAPLSWRAPFFVLVPPTAIVWWLMHRLPEPARGGASRMPPDAASYRRPRRSSPGGASPTKALTRSTIGRRATSRRTRFVRVRCDRATMPS